MIVRISAVLALLFGSVAVGSSAAGAASPCDLDGYLYGSTMILSANPIVAEPGTTVELTASGFPGDCDADLAIDGVSMAALTIPWSGEFSVTWNVPTTQAAGPVSATASVDGTVLAQTTITVQNPPTSDGIALVKSNDSPGPVADGDTVGYTLEITNSGTSYLTDLELQDDTLDPGSQSPDAATLSGIVLAPGSSTTVTGSYSVTSIDADAGSVVNFAQVWGTPSDSSGIPTGSPDVSASDASTVVTDSTVPPTSIPTTSMPPVTTVAPPVTTVAPPVSTVAPPVTTGAPPVSTVAPPVTTMAPPASTTVPGTEPVCALDDPNDHTDYLATAVLTVNPPEIVPGNTVVISGTGFPPNCEVVLSITDLPVRASGVIGTVMVSADGTFSMAWTVPEKQSRGSVRISASVDGESIAAVILSVVDPVLAAGTTTAAGPGSGTGPAGAASSGASGTGALPATGSSMLPLTVVGIGLLMLGAALVVINGGARTRRRA